MENGTVPLNLVAFPRSSRTVPLNPVAFPRGSRTVPLNPVAFPRGSRTVPPPDKVSNWKILFIVCPLVLILIVACVGTYIWFRYRNNGQGEQEGNELQNHGQEDIEAQDNAGGGAEPEIEFPATDYMLSQHGRRTECAICLVEFEEGHVVTVLQCSHIFHHACISALAHYNILCPCCRHRLDGSDD